MCTPTPISHCWHQSSGMETQMLAPRTAVMGEGPGTEAGWESLLQAVLWFLICISGIGTQDPPCRAEVQNQ